jgi:hypothetical protein
MSFHVRLPTTPERLLPMRIQTELPQRGDHSGVQLPSILAASQRSRTR